MSVPPSESSSDDRLSLELPLDAAHILTARLFAGGVARSLGLGEEASEGFRLTLTEICSEAIERRHGGRIAIDVLPDADGIRVTVEATGALEPDPAPTEGTLRRVLLEALAPDASFVEERDRSAVTFTM
jgi:anti-sigma regulatory factor (Ser/Thr protein kinase)